MLRHGARRVVVAAASHGAPSVAARAVPMVPAPHRLLAREHVDPRGLGGVFLGSGSRRAWRSRARVRLERPLVLGAAFVFL